jgi:hypothetical protein
MTVTDPIPNPLSKQDAAGLIGMLASLEGTVVADDLESDLVRRLVSQLRQVATWAGEEYRRASPATTEGQSAIAGPRPCTRGHRGHPAGFVAAWSWTGPS